MEVARLFGLRSTCPRAKVGVIATQEGRIVASGYVGSPSGSPHCLDSGCLMEDGHCVRTTHAEANLVSWAARTGTTLEGSTLWCTHSPCFACAKLLVNVGIVALNYEELYESPMAIGLLQEHDIVVRHALDETGSGTLG
jgi:dCMP deaminase